MVFAVIMAGGSGSRMGNSETPKQFMILGTKPIIIHSIEKFYVNSKFEKIIVMSPKTWVNHTRNMIEKNFGKTDRIVVVEGGSDRNKTLMNSLKYIEENYGLDDDKFVVTHDAVRPFVTHRIIEENIEFVQKYGACDTVVGATDTIVRSVDGDKITEIPKRPQMYQGQTPQSFNAKKLKDIYESLSEDEKAVLTDACGIFVKKNEPVHLVNGEVFNIKITYPYDLKVAKALLEETEGND